MHCCNRVFLDLPCCTFKLVVSIELHQSAIYYIMATRIGRSLTPLDSARLWNNAACVVANRMTSTNLSCLFGRVGELNVARETFSAYVQRVEMCFTMDNMVETTTEASAPANQVVANRKRAILLT